MNKEVCDQCGLEDEQCKCFPGSLASPFEDWLYGIESYGLRAERAYEEIYGDDKKWNVWLKAAFEAGKESMKDNKSRAREIFDKKIMQVPQWEDQERADYDLDTMVKEFAERMRPKPTAEQALQELIRLSRKVIDSHYSEGDDWDETNLVIRELERYLETIQ